MTLFPLSRRAGIPAQRRAFEVLQHLWPGVAFEPFAPESDRMQQLAQLRSRMERRVG